MKETNLNRKCLACGFVADDETPTGDPTKTPQPGNIAICAKCGHLMAFADDLSLRELTSQEMYDVAGRQELLALQQARAEAMEARERINNEPKPTEPIEELWAVLAVQPNGGEGIVGGKGPDGELIPMVCSKERLAPGMMMVARQSTSRVTGIRFRLVKFTRAETVEEFET